MAEKASPRPGNNTIKQRTIYQETRETEPGTGNRVRLTGNRLEPEPAWTRTGMNRNQSSGHNILFLKIQKWPQKIKIGKSLVDFF